MPADESDRLLVERVRRGNSEAWKELIARFEGRLLAFVDRRLNNMATSEDVVQETFLGFLISLPNYDENTPLDVFLFSIAAHKLTDVLRREGRRPTLPLLSSSSQKGSREPAGKARGASSLMRSRERRDVEEQILGRCLQELIDKWMKRGDFERLKCMELLFVLGCSNKAAASTLGISEQAVANHKHYVTSQLKESVSRTQMGRIDLSEFGISEKS